MTLTYDELAAKLAEAERARDESREELESAMHEIAGLSPDGYADSYVKRIAAFLAANGGANEQA